MSPLPVGDIAYLFIGGYMEFSIEDTLTGRDLEFECKEYLIDLIKQHINFDDEFKAELTKWAKEEKKEYDENGGSKLTLEDIVNLKAEELAEKAVDRIKTQVEFDFTITL